MAPLPAFSTQRYYVHYRANGRSHTVQFRYPLDGDPAEPNVIVKGGFTNILNAFAAFMPTDLAYLSAGWSAIGSNVELPASLPLLLSNGVGSPNAGEAPAFMSIPGRSVLGRRIRFTMLGTASSPAEGASGVGDYRLTSGESAAVAAIVTALDTSAMIAIDAAEPLWSAYANCGYNSHWQRAVRG